MALLGKMTGRAHMSVARAIQQAKREGDRINKVHKAPTSPPPRSWRRNVPADRQKKE